MIHLGDITKLHGDAIPPVDCITGGSPCQDLSVAGKRAGLEGERSGLFMEQIRIVKEMRERDRRAGRTAWAVRPRFMVWENVPGAFSSNGGKDFRAVLEEIVKVVEADAPDVPLPDKGKWSKAGCLYSDVGDWSVAWRVHDAQFWGVPQRRKRIALVADFGGLSAPEILFERKGLSRDSEPCGTTGQGTAAATESGTGSTSGSSGVEPVPIEGNGQRESHRGNGYGNEGDPMFTLNSTEHHAVAAEAYGICSYDSNAMKSPNPNSGIYKADTSRTLDLNGGSPACNQGGVAVVEVAELTVYNGENVTSPLNKTNPQPGDPCHTLGTDTRNYVVDATYCPEIAHTLSARHDGSPQPDKGIGVNFQNVCRVWQTVRRLTPTECERLQGYPDGWTDIGEWVDSKGKKHKAADSPRYKALGNSIALPFWFWLLRRISAQYERPATLGSLFDGIGGFPLCWERCNGKGTAIWASEIEEFPIAVTKVHFPEETQT